MMEYPSVWQTFGKVSYDMKRDTEFWFAELRELLEAMEAYIDYQREIIDGLEERIVELEAAKDTA